MSIDELLKAALEYGIFPALFVFAFWYIISEHKERENSQRELYRVLATDVSAISDTISGIEESSSRIDMNTSTITQEMRELRYMVTTLEANIKSKLKD